MILEIGIALGVGIGIAVIIALVLRRRRRLEPDTRTGQYEEEELTPTEAETLERMKKMRNLDPNERYEDYPLEEGARYDKWSGAIIYKDSEVIKPYIGSEEEELTPTEAETLERMKKMRNLDPNERYEDYPLEEGARYDKWSGAIIYKDSEVIKPYIGSEEEERDAERARIPKPPKSNEGEWPRSGCPTCFGHGQLNFGLGKTCPDCKGSGSVPNKR
jgi:DNA-directed RNA polymerase subunit F